MMDKAIEEIEDLKNHIKYLEELLVIKNEIIAIETHKVEVLHDLVRQIKKQIR